MQAKRALRCAEEVPTPPPLPARPVQERARRPWLDICKSFARRTATFSPLPPQEAPESAIHLVCAVMLSALDFEAACSYGKHFCCFFLACRARAIAGSMWLWDLYLPPHQRQQQQQKALRSNISRYNAGTQQCWLLLSWQLLYWCCCSWTCYCHY